MPHPLENLTDDDIVLDSLPDSVVASMEARDAWISSLPRTSSGLEFIVSDVQSWTPGQSVRVAFLGGSADLRRDIVEATAQITEACNLTLDFGWDGESDTFHEWSPGDTELSAEIRVSFDMGGYWSLVGTDSSNPNIGLPAGSIGGRPHQRSLNLGGFDIQRPSSWRGTVRHEFLHALGFHHEHQNMRGPCEDEFRWEDDEGYQPTTDSRGAFVTDSAGRRPGIYTYLSGFPNHWPRAKVDHNLRTEDDPDAVASVFDSASVMLYRFPALFYKTSPSPCAPSGDGQNLSGGDERGLLLLYPRTAAELSVMAERKTELLGALEPDDELGLEGVGGSVESAETFAGHAARVLRAGVEGLGG